MCKQSLLLLLATASLLISCQSKTQNGIEKGFTKTGYEYHHVISNDGPKPIVGDEIQYHQKIFLSDSLVMSTYLSMSPLKVIIPSEDKVAKPIRPDYEALFIMSPGDSLVTYQKLDTFAIEILPKGAKNTDIYRYEMRLLSIRNKAEVDKGLARLRARAVPVADSLHMWFDKYKSKKLGKVLQKSESGLEYIIHDAGSGKKADPGRFVTVHYVGCLMGEKKCFSSTFEEAKAYTARIGRRRVIKAWDEGIPMLSEGGKATFFVPYQLAYGLEGDPPTIPEKANLMFYVEVKKVY